MKINKKYSNKNYVHWDRVFENIRKYWNGETLKANIVITKDNINILFDIVRFLKEKGVSNIAITYPILIIYTMERSLFWIELPIIFWMYQCDYSNSWLYEIIIFHWSYQIFHFVFFLKKIEKNIYNIQMILIFLHEWK